MTLKDQIAADLAERMASPGPVCDPYANKQHRKGCQCLDIERHEIDASARWFRLNGPVVEISHLKELKDA